MPAGTHSKHSVAEVDIASIGLDPHNLREHGKRSVDELANSLGQFGAARSVVVDKHGIVRAGNGTLEAARNAGITKALVVETDGRQLVVVKRRDWSDEEAISYAIADNRIGELSKFNYEALGETLSKLRANEIPIVGFDAGELDMLLSAQWKPDEQIAVESYFREPAAAAQELSIQVLEEHAEEIGKALQLEMLAGAASESEALVRIVRRARV
jgi:hypothetical protein